jgi:hypothetical protein
MNQYQSTLLIVALFIAATLFAAREKGKVPQNDTVSAEQLRGYPDEPTFDEVETTRPQVESTRPQAKATRPFMAATSISGISYTPYQVAMWYLKAHESFRPYEYADGQYNSKGFGLNLSPDKVRWASDVLGFSARSRDWTWDEGSKVLQAYWQHKSERYKGSGTWYERTAVMLHAYNTGKYHNIRGCCGKKVGCGRKASNVRKAHNERRDFEWRLYQGLVTDFEIEALRKDAIRIEKKWK